MHFANTLTLVFVLSAGLTSVHTVHCWDRKHAAIYHYTYNGARYLRAGPEDSTATLDPDMCWRLSCSYNTAISWCNSDKKNRKNVRFHDTANDTQTIADQCSPGPKGLGLTGGMVDYRPASKWQVVVHKNDC